MHSAVPVIPPFLCQRPLNTNYWQNFHKWNFSANDDLTVIPNNKPRLIRLVFTY